MEILTLKECRLLHKPPHILNNNMTVYPIGYLKLDISIDIYVSINKILNKHNDPIITCTYYNSKGLENEINKFLSTWDGLPEAISLMSVD